jgi:hypothetical protein
MFSASFDLPDVPLRIVLQLWIILYEGIRMIVIAVSKVKS